MNQLMSALFGMRELHQNTVQVFDVKRQTWQVQLSQPSLSVCGLLLFEFLLAGAATHGLPANRAHVVRA